MSIAPTADPRALKILHVDDDAVNRLVLDQLLKALGHAPTATSGGREALDALDRQAFDLVISDVHMPEMDGVELLAAIQRGAHADIPVVAVTADVMTRVDNDYRELGFAGVISKPLVVPALQRILDQAARPRWRRTFEACGMAKG